jgi:hypothetical protein
MSPQYMHPSYPTTNVKSPRYVAPKSQNRARANLTQEYKGKSGGRALNDKGKGREKAQQPIREPDPIEDEWYEAGYIPRGESKASDRCDRRWDR